ncbi:MAG TPA: glycoside hydrolase domain-containing protein [Bacilli bacterium]|nr:glycoside hydrolase domain-containing protein [Bacilli bacterium]
MSSFNTRGWLAVLLVLALALTLTWVGVQHPAQDPGGSGGGTGGDTPSDPHPLWGIDTVNVVDPSFYACVADNYGTPAFVGRYLKSIPDISQGVTSSEVKFLHARDVKLLLIDNNFSSATGYENGQQEAQAAIEAAKRVGVPQDANIPLFADIETTYPVDAAWLKGWITTFDGSPYMAGFYANPLNGGFNAAYQQVVNQDRMLVLDTYVWSQQPSLGVTTEANAPAYDPARPDAPANTWVWQYGLEGKACNIDTDLIDSRLYDQLW